MNILRLNDTPCNFTWNTLITAFTCRSYFIDISRRTSKGELTYERCKLCSWVSQRFNKRIHSCITGIKKIESKAMTETYVVAFFEGKRFCLLKYNEVVGGL